MTENLRNEMAQSGVGVSLLCPGFVLTNLTENTIRISGVRREYSPGATPQSSVTSRDVGEMVIQGITDDAPYILTHPGVWESMAVRISELREACDVREREAAE